MTWRRGAVGSAGPITDKDLKVCELCGALNLEDNEECFVCSWRGSFDRRPFVLQNARELVERNHGRLGRDLVTDINASMPRLGRRRSPLELLKALFRWLFG
jgi:hypothetical protein